MTLSEKIQACRKRAGLSQEQLAERLGISRQAVMGKSASSLSSTASP
jgi:transcriptional regulator with XRE-family HTH domain